MASPIDTRNESLQCVACAIRQDENSNITETDLLQFMNWCRNSPSGAELTKFNRIKDHVDIDDQFYGTGQYSFKNMLDLQLVPASEKTLKEINIDSDEADIQQPETGSDLEAWVESSVAIANKLAASSYLNKNYIFAHADQRVGNARITIKDLAQKIVKDVKSVAVEPKFTTAINLIARGSGDKWNPADMFAYEKTATSSIGNTINEFERGNIPNVSADMKKANKELNDLGDKVKGRAGRNIEMIEEMHDLYAYNQLIDKYFEDGTVIPISLKKGRKGSVPLKLIKHKQTKGIEDALELEVKITNVTYVPTAEAGKAIVEFDIGGKAGAKLDFRGFEVTTNIENIQAQIQAAGSTSSHGKITLPLYSFIVEESQGMNAIKAQRRIKQKLFGNDIPTSGDILFTPASIFVDYANTRGTRGRFNQTTLVEDTPKWAQYIQWLTKGSMSSGTNIGNMEIVRRVRQKLGDPTGSTEAQMPKGKIRGRETIVFAGGKKSLMKAWERDSKGKLKKMTPNTTYKGKPQDYIWAAKYIKTVVQSAEAAFVVDLARKAPKKSIKENILKSAYLYAASKGLRIFSNTEVKEFFSASTYLKVGG